MIEATSNADRVQQQMSRLTPEIQAQLRSAYRMIGQKMRQLLGDKLDSGEAGLTSRTGNAKRALFDRVDENGRTMKSVAGFDLRKAKYMAIQITGGTIAAKGRRLTIPLPDAMTPKGLPRFTARELIASPSGYGFKSTFMAKDVIFGLRDRKHPPVPLFALKDRVTIPPHPMLASTLESQRGWAEEQANNAVKAALQKVTSEP